MNASIFSRKYFLLAPILINVLFFNYSSAIKVSPPESVTKVTRMSFPNLNFKKAIATASISSMLFLNILPTFPAHAGIFNEVWTMVNDNFVDSSYNNVNWKKVHEDYSNRLANGADERELTKKMLELLGDKYTRILDKESFEALFKYDAIGVGLLLQSDPNQKMTISSPPIPNSSGAKAGMLKGDVIFSINGKSTEGMSALQALDMLSNDNSNKLTLVYSHDGSEKQETVTLQRSKPAISNPVSYYSQKVSNGKKIGYVKLSDFNAEAVPGMKSALIALESEKVDIIVLDLRGNTGGGFQFALNIGGMFMDNKQMVTAAGHDKENNVFKTSFPEGVLTNAPLLIWVDELSASASEVLAGGLHDNCRATVIGSTSFGKGKIQAVFGLSDGEGMTMTVAQYVTPRGTVIQSNGIKPDVSLPSMNAYMNLAFGSIINRPNLNTLDFDNLLQYFKMCSPLS